MPKAKELKLHVVYDKGGYIRPFINDWNVWTLKKSEFTPAVSEAILHAYTLGYDHALKDVKHTVWSIWPPTSTPSTKFNTEIWIPVPKKGRKQ